MGLGHFFALSFVVDRCDTVERGGPTVAMPMAGSSSVNAPCGSPRGCHCTARKLPKAFVGRAIRRGGQRPPEAVNIYWLDAEGYAIAPSVSSV